MSTPLFRGRTSFLSTCLALGVLAGALVATWSVADGTLVGERRYFDRMPQTLAQSPDGQLLALGFYDARLVISPTSRYEELHSVYVGDVLKGSGGGPVMAVDFSDDGKQVVAAAWAGLVFLETETGAARGMFDVNSKVCARVPF